jgi:predicted ATP-dependent endonuclease of OLD family
MKLEGFQVKNYRNIHDSGWVIASSITTLVGQNECGKSNLLRALHRLNPIDDAQFELNADWPIDLWPPDSSSPPVCEAKFSLSESETNELRQFLNLAPEDDDTGDSVDDSTPRIEVELPEDVLITAVRNYDNTLDVCSDDFAQAGMSEDQWVKWIEIHLPKSVYMEDYGIFAGHCDLTELHQKESKLGRSGISEEERTILVTLDLASLKLADLVTKSNTDEGRTLRGFDTSAASSALTRRFMHKWKQKRVKFSIRTDGPTLDFLVEDDGLDAFVPLERRSRGFQWFVSFVWRFTHASKGEFSNCLLLLDEPGIHLHHAGHRDLLDFVEELSESNPVVYTTHLSTMLDPGYPERIKIMEVSDHKASVSNSMVSKQRHPMMVIESLLGLDPAMSGLLGNRRNLIVEGVDEVIVLSKLSSLFREAGREGLSDRVYMIPAHGASKTPVFAAFMIGHGFDAAVLLDSDEAGNRARTKIKNQREASAHDAGTTAFRVIMLGDATNSTKTDVALEDLFEPEFYVECVNEAYGVAIHDDQLPVDGSTQIVKRVEQALIVSGHASSLDKGRVMAIIQTKFETWTGIDALPKRTQKMAEKLFETIARSFEPHTPEESEVK